MQYFTDGAVIGGQAIVDCVFNSLRHRFGSKRKAGARRLRGNEAEAGVFALRDLREDLFD